MRIKCSEYLNIITHWIQSRKQKRCIFFNAPLPPGITSGKDWFQHSKGVYSEKHNCCVKSSNKATCRSRTDMLLVLNFEKLNVWTPQIHRPRCYYIICNSFMQAEKSRSGANGFFPVENILIHTVFNAKGWNKRLMLLYHAALFHANRKPPTSATIDGSLRKDFRINFNFDSESTKTNFAITTATQSPFVFDYGARAPRRHVSSHSQQWIGSCHSITRRCRRGYFFEYE